MLHLLKYNASLLFTSSVSTARVQLKLSISVPTTTTRLFGLALIHRDNDDVSRRLRRAEAEVVSERQRADAVSADHQRELHAALSERAEARALVGELKVSLEVPQAV